MSFIALILGLGFIAFIALVFFCYCLLGRWVYNDAMARGLPPIAWVLVVLFTPLFLGLVIYLVYREDKNIVIQCPNCRLAIAINSNFCPDCGYQCPPDKKITTYPAFPKKIIFTVLACFMIALGVLLLAAGLFRSYRANRWVNEASSFAVEQVPAVQVFSTVADAYNGAIKVSSK